MTCLEYFKQDGGADGDSMSSNVATLKPSTQIFLLERNSGLVFFFLFLFFPSGLFRRRQKKAASRRLKMVDLCEAEAKRGYNPKAYKKIRSVSHDSWWGPDQKCLLKTIGPFFWDHQKKISHGWLHFVVITAGPHIVVPFEDQWTWNESGQTNWGPGVQLTGGWRWCREYDKYTYIETR